MTFADAVAGPNGVPLFPVQLVEAVCEFAICAILVRMSVSGASRREPWMLVVAYILMYAPVRFVLEFFRGNATSDALDPLGNSSGSVMWKRVRSMS